MGLGAPLGGKLADLGSCCCCCCCLRAAEALECSCCASSLPLCRAKWASSPVTAPDFTCATASMTLQTVWFHFLKASYNKS